LISDSVVDEFLSVDPDARVACEVLAAKGTVVVAGEITSAASVDVEAVIRKTIASVGYDSTDPHFSASDCRVLQSISLQSESLRQALVWKGNRGRFCAGDQALVIGYAERNSFGQIPVEAYIAKTIARELSELRLSRPELGLRPDGKVLVGVSEDAFQSDHCQLLVVSLHHSPDADRKRLEEAALTCCCDKLGTLFDGRRTLWRFNPPTGEFVFGGPSADTGLTGRKLVCDAYGPSIPVGGGALSGKDPTKIDRTGAYASRWIAKWLLESGECDSAKVALSYVIGDDKPVGIDVVTSGAMDATEAKRLVLGNFDLCPGALIREMDLLRPIYAKACRAGHFGTDQSLPWEMPSLVRVALVAP
jgi:S-adenosylmethionine synthetase